MIRGFATTLAIVSTAILGAWAYAEQSRLANATIAVQPAGLTVSTAAVKGDRLQKADKLEAAFAAVDGYGVHQDARIIQAHAKAIAENNASRFMTVGMSTGERETVLIRVPVEQ